MQTASRSPTMQTAQRAESFGAPARQPPDFRQMTELAFKLSKETDARIVIYGDASQEAIRKLQALLALSEDAFPTRAELYPPRTAMWRNKDHDQPVTITGELGEKDGKRFYAARETATGIPEDEIEFD